MQSGPQKLWRPRAIEIPRLELMEALLLARLIVSTTNSLSSELKLDPPVCYTDSKITL